MGDKPDRAKLEYAKRLERAGYALAGSLALVFAIVLTICLSRGEKTPPVSGEPTLAKRIENVRPLVEPNADPDDESEDEEDEEDDAFETEFDDAEDGEYDGDLSFLDEDEELWNEDEFEYDDFENEGRIEDVEAPGEDASEEEGADDESESANDAFSKVVVVPDDFETLAEALDAAAPLGTVILKKRAKEYRVGQSAAGRRLGFSGAYIDRAITIRGETGDASDVTISAPNDRRVWIDSSGAARPVVFEDITFRSEIASNGTADFCPVASVASGEVEFRNCEFIGDRGANLGAIAAESAFASVKCFECRFSNFGGSALYVASDAWASAIRCEFNKRGRYGIYVESNGKIDVVDATFSQNEVAIFAASGASGVVRGCSFRGNRKNWALEDAWENSNLSCLGNKE